MLTMGATEMSKQSEEKVDHTYPPLSNKKNWENPSTGRVHQWHPPFLASFGLPEGSISLHLNPPRHQRYPMQTRWCLVL